MRPPLALAAALFVALLWQGRALAMDPATMPTPQLQARYVALIHEFRCLQCHGESLADSPVSLAADLRREIRELLLAGKSDEDIRNYLVSRYSEFILFRPRFNWKTAWLWSAPFVLLVVGAFAAVRILRQRMRLLDSDPDEVLDPDAIPRDTVARSDPAAERAP